jgi:uncharacterized oxidoreductase
MNLSGKTILITGGSSGIGFELARRLCAQNTVIVTGRSQEKLEAAKAALARIHIYRSDAGDLKDIESLHRAVTQDFPSLDVLINNAGIMRKVNLRDGIADLTDLNREIEINLSGPILMVKQFLPHLERQRAAVIVNVTSGLAFVPFPISPVYSATKAGLHAFTQALRVQMRNSSVQVFELAPPGTETPLFRGDFDATDLGSVKGMDVSRLVELALRSMRNDTLEIRPGQSNLLKLLSRIAPQFALNMLARATAASLLRMSAHANA